jgi:hypothetical protein
MRGVPPVCQRIGSSFEEDGEDQVERPRSRPVERNQCRSYSRELNPEGRIQLRERQQRRATDEAHGRRLKTLKRNSRAAPLPPLRRWTERGSRGSGLGLRTAGQRRVGCFDMTHPRVGRVGEAASTRTTSVGHGEGKNRRCHFGDEPSSECAANAFGRAWSREMLTNARAVVLRSHRPSRVLAIAGAE